MEEIWRTAYRKARAEGLDRESAQRIADFACSVYLAEVLS